MKEDCKSVHTGPLTSRDAGGCLSIRFEQNERSRKHTKVKRQYRKNEKETPTPLDFRETIAQDP